MYKTKKELMEFLDHAIPEDAVCKYTLAVLKPLNHDPVVQPLDSEGKIEIIFKFKA